jgi:WD40 repeat protein
VQAGLIPKLKDNLGANKLVNLTFVPDVNPFESFYCLLGNRYTQSQAKLAQAVKEDTLIKVVEGLKNNSDLWFIFIDQFEELFTRTPKTERDIFIKSLIKLIENNNSLVKIVMTMRADFLDKLSPYPSLGKIHDQYSKMLTDMDESELRLAIAEPAARNGVIFEKGLINQIVADFYEQAGSLPLLQYTLDLLWQKNHIQNRVLNIKTYQEIGGVTGALEKQADKIYSKFDEQQRKAAEEIFLELISLEGEKAVSRRADKSSFEQEEMQREVLYQLIDNRLLVSKGEDGKATVEVAHEELIRSWKVLQDLIREKEEIIVLRSRLYADAKQWDDLQKQDAVKASSELWGGSKLKRIVNLIKEKSLSNLDDVAVKFIKASYHYQKQREKIEAERKRREVDTELSLANSLGRYSLSLFNEGGKDLEAFIEMIKAGKILQKYEVSDTKVMDALQKVLTEGREYNRLDGHNGSVNSVSFSPDGKTLATGSSDNTIKLWDVETGKEIRTLSGHNGYARGEDNHISSVSFSSDGKTLTSGSNDDTIILWNVETGEEIRTLSGHNGSVNSVSFSPDGKTLATGSRDKTIKLWNVETGQEIRTLSGHNEGVSSVSFSPDGNTLVSGSGTIKLWNVETGKEICTLSGHNREVNSVSFSSDGKTLATGSEDNTIKLWDVETGKGIRTLSGHNGSVYSVSFSNTLSGHNGSVYSVSFSNDGKTLASGGWDNTIKLWNVETGQEIRTLKGHDSYLTSVNFSPDGKTLVSGSDDNTIKLWNGSNGWDLDALMERSCDWVRVYLHNPNSGVKEEDRHLCDGIGEEK